MAGSMAGSCDNDDAPVTEHIMVSIEKHGFAVLERAESGCRVAWIWRRRVWKHCGAFRFLHEPCCTGKVIRISGMIVMVVREREVCNVGWFVTDFCQLTAHCFANG